MKTSLVVLLALCAMAYAQGDHSVHVAESADQAPIIVNPDSAFYRPSNGPGNNINILPDQAFGRPSVGPGNINIVPDSGFSNPQGGGGVQPSFGPTFVDTSRYPPYPYKQYDNPQARGGK